MRATAGGCWPSPDQRLLLIAAFGDRDPAAAAAAAWLRTTDIDQVDPASFRLLPQLYTNLVHHDLGLPIGRLRGIHRQSWYRNRLQFRQLAVVVDALARAGLDTLLLKGAALAPQYFADLGARPMADLDVAVARGQARSAAEILERLGWTADFSIDERALHYTHAAAFRHPEGWELDLHWRVLPAAQHDAADTAFWAASRPVAVDGTTSRALDPTHELLVALVHGIEWNAVASIRWVGDAWAILRSDGIDWDLLVRRACDLQVVVPVRQGLAYLHDQFGCAVPDDALSALSRAHVPWWAHAEMTAKQRPWSSVWAPPVLLVLRVARARRQAGVLETLTGLAGLVAWRLGIDRFHQIPAGVWGWLVRLRRRRQGAAPTADPLASPPARMPPAGADLRPR